MAKAILKLELELDKNELNNGLIKQGEVKEVIDICNEGMKKYNLKANKIDVAINEYSDEITVNITLQATGDNENIIKLSNDLAALAMKETIEETKKEIGELIK